MIQVHFETSCRVRAVIFHQFFTYNRYFLVITTLREEKPWPGNRKSKVDTLSGTKKSEDLENGYLTKNREPNWEVQAWTSWVNQEVIGYTRKLLFL